MIVQLNPKSEENYPVIEFNAYFYSAE